MRPASLLGTVTFWSSSTGPRSTVASRVSGVGSSLPTIISARSCDVTLLGSSTSPTVLPWRITVIASACLSTSSSLWEMKMIVAPSVVSSRNERNNSSTSCGTRTAVGSSRIRMLAPRYRTFRISTRCLSPTPRSYTMASGSTLSPYCAPNSRSRAFASAGLSANLVPGSWPSTMFSQTEKLAASMKCWNTMPIPAAIASRGVWKSTSSPLTRIVPSSGRCAPYSVFISVDLPAPFSPTIA